MKSAVRQRKSAVEDHKLEKRRVSWHEDVIDNGRDSSSLLARDEDSHALPWHLVLLYLLILTAMAALSLHFFWRLPEPYTGGGGGGEGGVAGGDATTTSTDNNNNNRFHALRARAHMEDIVSLGIRVVGSRANEVHAKEMLVSKLEALRALANERVELEISVQHPSGSFYIDFLGGINHLYQNVTNVVVRLSRKGAEGDEARKNAFMINAHYDSALGSVAASDDAISCGTMLEVIRCIVSGPAPLALSSDHALIFLFNGAEETLLQASHGFVTQHPWAGTVRAFLNLEAAGAGGKEIVFQTGPDHPWLARLYSESVPHPHASIIAQEVFQSGIIPSDTDFRIFREFGNIPGIDTAYFVNGYVYHTEYDIPAAIPDGSIQRAGENVLAILHAVARAPQLSDPSAGDLHGKVVFFDIFGLMTVVYSERVAVAMNIICVLLVVAVFFRDIDWSGNNNNSNKPSLRLFATSFVVMITSWIAALLTVVAVATVVTVSGRSMSWFSRPLLLIPLYALPAFLTVCEVHTQLIKRTCYSLAQLEKSSVLCVQFLWSCVLVILTCLHICSAFIFFINISFQLIFRSLLHDLLLSPELAKNRFDGIRRLAFVLCSVFATGCPLMLRLQLDVGMMQLFVPLTGRLGTVVPPDLVLVVIIAGFVATSSAYVVSVLVYSTSRQLKVWCGALMLGVSVLTLVAVVTGFFRPFSVQDKNFPTPKRLFLLHTDRSFFSKDGSLLSSDSKIYLYPGDYLGMEPIPEVSPIFKQARPELCKGLLCQEPIYLPVRQFMDSWTLPAPPLTGREGARISLISSYRTSDNSKRLNFKAQFPLRCVAVAGLVEGVVIKAWSLEPEVPPPVNCPGSHEERGCHLIFHARGFGDGEFTFWMELEGDVEANELLRILVTAHHLTPPNSVTDELRSLESALPDWVSPVSWTAIYREWVF